MFRRVHIASTKVSHSCQFYVTFLEQDFNRSIENLWRKDLQQVKKVRRIVHGV